MTSKVLVLAFFVSLSQGQSYYWRSFDGNIPKDAVVGSKSFGFDEYIGRGPIPDKGIYAGPIIPGTNSITVASDDTVYTLYDSLEILCGDSTALTWTPTNYTLFKGDPNKEVLAGFNYFLADLYLGRIYFDNENSSVGNVYRSTFYYHSNGKVANSSEFEVLVYEP